MSVPPFRSILLAGLAALTGRSHAVAADTCMPALAFKEVHFSPMQPPTMQRRWSASIAVDASRCAANAAGQFEIVFVRLKETAPDAEFRQQFTWHGPVAHVDVDFWADEAVARYWFDKITPCTCRD
jgi:hypothetical protein